MDYTFSDKISSLQPSAIREILKATADPKIIPLAAGNPAPDAFPVEEVRAIAADILDSRPIDALQYGVSEGYQPLRDTVKKWMKNHENIGKDFDDVLIVSGATQVMDLTTKVLCNEGDTVICEEPSFIGSLCLKKHSNLQKMQSLYIQFLISKTLRVLQCLWKRERSFMHLLNSTVLWFWRITLTVI